MHPLTSRSGRGQIFLSQANWERRLATYLRPNLLILDDFGLKPIQPPGPEDLYDVINERYERRSILLTSNRAPNEWPDLFLDPLLASAGLDRLMDRAEVVIIRGASYRALGRSRLMEEVPPNPKLP
jgi:DNA replication protein DnaC